MNQTKEKHDQYYEMAHSPISHIIPKLAAPTIVSMLISSIYNMADTFFVSQLGTSASGAVGVIFSAMAIIQALAFMIGMGSGNYMTRSFRSGQAGTGRTDRFHRLFYRYHHGPGDYCFSYL